MNRSNVAERPPRANVSDIFRVWRDDKPADVNHLHAALLLALHEHRDAQPPEFDERSADRTWRVRSKAVESRAEESVLLTRFLAVLAHELGHFFGNGHSDVPDNLMSYSRTGGRVFLDETQIDRIHMFSMRFLAAGRLADVGPPRFLP